jgi:hypothetical protein
VLVPVTPGRDHRLDLDVVVPTEAIPPVIGVRVMVNGTTVGIITRSGRQTATLTVSAATIGESSVARLELRCRTWQPSRVQPGSRDERLLGLAVRRVEITRAGSEANAPQPARLDLAIDPARLASLTRLVGRGRTIHLAGLASDPRGVARVVAAVVPEGVDGRLDRRFATRTRDGTLWLDPAIPTIHLDPAR